MKDDGSFTATVSSVITSQIGRVVAFVLAPILLVAVPPVTNAINSVFGLGFSDQQISNVVIAIVVGLALVIFKWLSNRGEYERIVLELHKLYEAGSELAGNQGANSVSAGGASSSDPVTPPGIGGV